MLLISAKKQGLIPAVVPMLKYLREQGYWFADEVVMRVRDIVGE